MKKNVLMAVVQQKKEEKNEIVFEYLNNRKGG